MDTLIYVHAVNDKESRLPAGLLDVGTREATLSPLSAKRTCRMPTSPLPACWLLCEIRFREPISGNAAARPQSDAAVKWMIWRLSVNRRKKAGEKACGQRYSLRPTPARRTGDVGSAAPTLLPRTRPDGGTTGIHVAEYDESVGIHIGAGDSKAKASAFGKPSSRSSRKSSLLKAWWRS